MQEKIIIKLNPTFDEESKVTLIRKNEATIEIDEESGLVEYDIKIDYDQDVDVDEKGIVNLAYKKYEKGMVHMKDVVGIWSTSSTSDYKFKADTVEERYKHQIEIATIGEPLIFTIDRKDLKGTYETLKSVFNKFKTRK